MFGFLVQERKQVQALEVVGMVLARNDGFQGETADVVFLVPVKAVGALVLHRAHRIMVGKIAFELIVLDNGLAPFTLVAERFADEEHGLGSTLLVLGEALEHAGALLDDLVVLHPLFGRRRRGFRIGDAVQARRTHLGRLVVQALRIEHVVQVRAARAAFEYKGGKRDRDVADAEHGCKNTKIAVAIIRGGGQQTLKS